MFPTPSLTVQAESISTLDLGEPSFPPPEQDKAEMRVRGPWEEVRVRTRAGRVASFDKTPEGSPPLPRSPQGQGTGSLTSVVSRH